MLTTSQLDSGERLLLDRRRAGETKVEAAERWGVTLYRYGQWEAGTGEDPPDPPLGRMQRHEKLLIMRRRAGLSVGQLGALAALSAWWVTQIENGEAPPARLESFWRERAGVRARPVRKRRRASG